LLREKGKVEEAARRGGDRGGARSVKQRKERGAGKEKRGADKRDRGVGDTEEKEKERRKAGRCGEGRSGPVGRWAEREGEVPFLFFSN
jgi:hypothetical protein